MSEHTSMDDRFDRRELLLHLGDVLDALSCLAATGEPGASVVYLMQKHASLQDFEFLRALAPEMTATEFSSRVASSFFKWPRELLNAELNRNALTSSIQHNLFSDNPDGWNAYVSYVQAKVKWFGTGLSKAEKQALAEPPHNAAEEARPVEASVSAVSPLGVDVRNEKKGWPWPEPRS